MESSIAERLDVAAPSLSPRAFHVDHAITEFAQGVQFMAESGGNEGQIGKLVERLTVQLERQGQGKRIHPLLWANAAAIIGLIFTAGQQFQRLNDIDLRIKSMANVETVTQELRDLKEIVTSLRTDVDRVRERMDRTLDSRGK